MSSRLRQALAGYGLLAPALLVFGAFSFYPLGRIIWLGLHEQNRTGTRQRWIGPSQYTDVLTGEDFRDGLWITAQFVLLTVPAGIVLGILLAVAANRHLRGIKVFQIIFSSTIASSTAVTAVVFFVLLEPSIGYVSDPWIFDLLDPDRAIYAVALTGVWQNLGLTFIITLAGLQAVPDDLLEAARLDGFGPVRTFTRVTLPLITPTLLFLSVALTVFGLQAFAQVDPEHRRKRVTVTGELPSPLDPPAGCAFHTRCPYATDDCRARPPDFRPVDGRLVACHHAETVAAG